MITHNPYSHRNIIKPGRAPEPLKPVHTCDTPDIIAICMECPVNGGCRPNSSECPLNGGNRNKKEKMRERDEKLAYMLAHGRRNTEAICEELHISKAALSAAKKRMRELGEVE